MQIQVSMISETPAYEQIKMQIKEAILSGTISAGTQLPSIRLMAKDLNVGIITVKRAYEELERDGIICSMQGKGCFVNEIDRDSVRKMYRLMLKEQMLDIKELSCIYGINKSDILEIVNELWGDEIG